MISIGQVLNNTYKITEEIGSGGGGIVFKAYHLRLEKYVAIKLIKEKVKGKINERAEADILKRLKHEGLPQVYDFINDGEDVYTVMEFIDGCSLNNRIAEKGRISYRQSLEWAKELCSAAAYLHTRKPPIIHSDIKPQNIMITDEGRVCLIDFNISSVFDGSFSSVGTSDGYSPPEQYEMFSAVRERKMTEKIADNDETVLIDENDSELTEVDSELTEILPENKVPKYRPAVSAVSAVDERSDVYSIGAVIYSMVTGKKPGNSRGNVAKVNEIDPAIPEALAFIINKAMSKDKEKRFSSAVEMLKALENIKKLDKRYKRAELRRRVMFIFCLLLFCSSAVSVIAGYRMRLTENDAAYTACISQLDEMCYTDNYDGFDEVWSIISTDYADKIEPYYYYAFKSYNQSDYEQAEYYLDEYVLKNLNDFSEEIQGNACYIKADIRFANEDFENANGYYEKAVSLNRVTADIYRDYAISLARTNDTDSSQRILELAIEYGMSDDGIYMVNGEINFARSEYAAAAENLQKAVSLTEDNVMKRNAYILCSRSYKAQYSLDNEELISENITLLENAIVSLPQEMLSQIYEYLAQAYIDYGETTGRKDYFAKALTLLDEMRNTGWRNYTTEMNVAVLCDKLGDTEAALEQLSAMLDVPEYANYYYIIYIRMAYCEADRQSTLDVSERDYSVFDEYYQSALDEYKANNVSDPEMDRLTQIRDELVKLDWLR